MLPELVLNENVVGEIESLISGFVVPKMNSGLVAPFVFYIDVLVNGIPPLFFEMLLKNEEKTASFRASLKLKIEVLHRRSRRPKPETIEGQSPSDLVSNLRSVILASPSLQIPDS